MQDQGNNNLILVSNKENFVQSSAAKIINIYTVLTLFDDLSQCFEFTVLTYSHIQKIVDNKNIY